uniref:PCI domain-containing protein n=1 Tax=Auxenochlorella protothecoides TaxID=3075 RepID=A0A1D2A2X4_AUXPR
MEIDAQADASLDLESLFSGATGAARLEHLLFVADKFKGQELELEALRLAADQLAAASNVKLHREVLERIGGRLGPAYVLDRPQLEAKERALAAQSSVLDADLAAARATQSKDAVRAAHRALADCWASQGAVNEAMKGYMRMREFCTQPDHVLTMCISIIKCAVAMRQWVHVAAYRKRGESVVASSTDTMAKSQLAAAGGLYSLSQAKFEEAARSYVEVSPDLGSEFSDVISAQDIATHGAMCALASLDRPALQSLVIDSPGFREHLESVPEIRDAVNSFHASRFADCLRHLEAARPGMELSPHLAPHLPALFKEIRRRGLELHARPYATLALSGMGAALGLIPADLEAELEALIVGGRLSARIDGAAGVLRAHRPDARAGALGAVLAAGEEFVAASRLLALRASVLQHGLVQRSLGAGPGAGRGDAQRHPRQRDRVLSS